MTRPEITEETVEQAQALINECYGKFIRPMANWLSEQTGEENAHVGFYVLVETIGMTLGLMLCEEPDEIEFRREQVRVTDQLLAASERIYGQRAEVLALPKWSEPMHDQQRDAT